MACLRVIAMTPVGGKAESRTFSTMFNIHPPQALVADHEPIVPLSPMSGGQESTWGMVMPP